MIATDQPADIQAEKAVIGALLIDPEAIEQIAPLLTPEDFSRPAGRLIFAAMLRVRAQGLALDYVTLCGEMEDSGQLGLIGGDATLTGLINCAPTSLHAVSYATRVASKARERRGESEVVPIPEQEPSRPRLTDRLGLADDSDDQESW